MALVLVACGGEKLVEIEIAKMVVDQSFGELSEEDVANLVNEEEGVKEAEFKDDGVLVFKLTKEGHDKLVEEMDEQVQNIINELRDSDQIPFVKDITYEKDYKEVKILVDKEDYETNPETGTVVAGMIGGAVGAKIIVEDEAGEELTRLNYPDDLKGVLGY